MSICAHRAAGSRILSPLSTPARSTSCSKGRSASTKQGGLKALFRDLPDEPLDRFEMTLFGGKRGLLQNSANVCAEPPLAQVKALGQTNLGYIFTSTLRGQCKKRKKKHKRKHRRHLRHVHAARRLP